MNMRNLLPLFASLLLCSGGIVLQAQTAATPQTPQAQPAPPAPPASAVAPEAPQGATPAVALLMEEGNFLGILPGDVTRENMGRYGLREPRGVLVTKVIESSPAARAGLKEGDVILRFDNEPVTSVRQLNRLINEAAPEQTVRLSMSRQGSEQEINATLARRKDFPSLQGALPTVEMLRALPQVGTLAIPHIDMSRMVLPVLPKINFASPRMNFRNIQKFKLAPMNLPDLKLLTPKIAPMPM